MRADGGRRIETRELVLWALLISLEVVLSRLASIRIVIGGVEGVRLGFGAFPSVLAGIALGPLAGGAVGALGDLIGYWINPAGIYMPHFTLTAALTGILPALLYRRIPREGLPPAIRTVLSLLAVGLGMGIPSLLLVPLFLRQLFGIPYLVTLPARVISLVVTVPIFSLLAEAIMRRTAPLLARFSR
jgi:ECF transporter S component (folate family)